MSHNLISEDLEKDLEKFQVYLNKILNLNMNWDDFLYTKFYFDQKNTKQRQLVEKHRIVFFDNEKIVSTYPEGFKSNHLLFVNISSIKYTLKDALDDFEVLEDTSQSKNAKEKYLNSYLNIFNKNIYNSFLGINELPHLNDFKMNNFLTENGIKFNLSGRLESFDNFSHKNQSLSDFESYIIDCEKSLKFLNLSEKNYIYKDISSQCVGFLKNPIDTIFTINKINSVFLNKKNPNGEDEILASLILSKALKKCNEFNFDILKSFILKEPLFFNNIKNQDLFSLNNSKIKNKK